MLQAWIRSLVCLRLLLVGLCSSQASMFNSEVSPLHIWITSSSLANRHSDGAKSLIFRQIEINWINAQQAHEDDYIALYLDGRAQDGIMPVRVHPLNGQVSGQITTDYYLPLIDFFNETLLPSRPVDSLYPPPRFDHLALRDSEELPNNKSDGHSERAERSSEQLRLNPATENHLHRRLVEQCVGYCIAYHSGRRILAENCLKTNPTWMQDSYRHLKTKSLPALMIPGTHNSATYPRHLDKSVLHLINKYELNQDDNIFSQLVYGIRYLDLRVGYSKVKHSSDKFWIYHDIFRTEVPVSEVLEQVRRFLDLTSHEIIILDFHRFTVGFHHESAETQRERHSKLIDMIVDYLGDYIVPSYLGYHAPLVEYISMGRRLLVGYAERDKLLDAQVRFAAKLMRQPQTRQQVRDIDDDDHSQENLTDAAKPASEPTTSAGPTDGRIGTRVLNRIKSMRLMGKRSADMAARNESGSIRPAKLISASPFEEYMQPPIAASHEAAGMSLAKASLFFPQIKHLWPNKDSMADFALYLNETACRMYFGELRSLMVELTPTVFGAISDKYDGNRKLAQLVNRPVTDWIRDRWLHCVNIVASDFFLGNDLIRLSIDGNRMRALHEDVDLSEAGHCRSFRRIGHLLDKSRIPKQFIQLPPEAFSDRSYTDDDSSSPHKSTISHVRADGSRVELRLLTSGSADQPQNRERRESFVDSVSDSFMNLFSSFKRLLNL